MKKPIFVILILLMGHFYCFAQSDTIPQSIILSVSKKDEWKFKQKLTLYRSMMNIAADPLIQSFPDSTWQYTGTDFNKDLFIQTESGLEWSLCDEPPKKPACFLLKALSEKGRNKPQVKKRLEYHQLVSEINTEKSAYLIYSYANRTDSTTMKDYDTWIIYSIDSTGNKPLKKYYRLKE